jgi:hypothetical protein
VTDAKHSSDEILNPHVSGRPYKCIQRLTHYTKTPQQQKSQNNAKLAAVSCTTGK